MGTSWIPLRFFFGLFLAGFCGRLCFAVKPLIHPIKDTPQSLSQQSQVPLHGLAQEQVNTVSIICHPDSVEIVIQADMFAIGAPVDNTEVRLGVERSDYCTARASEDDVYRIRVGLDDCGNRHWMDEDAVIYTNILIYSPMASPDGIVRMDEAVIPLECHYERKYSVSSSSLKPTWIPFTSTQATVETLQFNLRIMTDDWNYERAANVFFLGEPIKMEASVRVGHHTGLRVFLSSCVATLTPDIHSDPKYIFIENGCLVDSQLPDSKAHFLPRTEDEKLHLVIDAFKFHSDDRGELYITCHLNAAPVTDTEAPNKACTFMNGRWRSADGNDYLCGYCKGQSEAAGKASPGSFGPRGFVSQADFEPMRRTGQKSKQGWDHEARLGPVTILPLRKSGPLPAEQLPPVLYKIHRPTLYGSHWRSGINKLDLEDLFSGPSTPELVENETAPKGEAEELILNNGKPLEMPVDKNATASSDAGFTSQFAVAIPPTNATATVSDLSEMTDPKK